MLDVSIDTVYDSIADVMETEAKTENREEPAHAQNL